MNSIAKVCSVEGCDSPKYGRGLCTIHLRRLKVHGDVNYVRPPRKHEIKKKCTIEGCGKPGVAFGLCDMHRWRLKYYGDVNHTKTYTKRICKFKGCTSFAESLGWCEKHYSRWKSHGDPSVVKLQQEKHGMTKSPEYQSWRAMKDRCATTGKRIGSYAAKGIKICARWRTSFTAFYEDMGKKPDLKHSIDRKNVDGHYSCGKCEECIANGWPANCRWATKNQQAVNTHLYKNNSTGLRGVHRTKNGKWHVSMQHNKRTLNLGTYEELWKAIWVYNKATIIFRGTDAKLNRITDLKIQ